MKVLRQPIRNYVTFIVLLMGLLGLGLALATGEFYRHLIMKNQRAALARFCNLAIADLLDALDTRARDLGLSLQHQPALLRAYRQRDVDRLIRELESQYRRYFVTSGILKVERLQVFDLSLRPVAHSDGGDPLGVSGPVCPGLFQQAQARQGPDRLKPISDLCVAEGRPVHALLVPIGGLRLQGYMQVVTDPVHWLRRVEDALSMPIRLRSKTGAMLHRSDSWDSVGVGDRLVATSAVTGSAGQTVLNLDVASDTEGMNRQLSEARYLVVTIAGLATAAVTLLALYIFQITTVRPLRFLTERLRALRGDRSDLGKEITVVANSEVVELAEDFNEMTSELKQLHTNLEHLVDLRTRELLAANRELESFSNAVSHDLQSPLRAINAFCRVLQEEHGNAIPEAAQHYLERIEAAALRMGRLVEGLLVLTAVVRRDLQQREVDLSAMAREISDEIRKSAPTRNAHMVIEKDLRTIGDPNLVRLLLKNLIGNAWKFSNGGECFIAFSKQMVEGREVFCVADRGVGFDMRFVSKLFQPFQRLHGQEEYDGIGIGLATVQRVAQRHGGEVWAESSEGEGTNVFFTLQAGSPSVRPRVVQPPRMAANSVANLPSRAVNEASSQPAISRQA